MVFFYQPPGHKRTETLYLLFHVLAPHPSRPRARRRPPLLLVPGIRRGEPGHTQLQQQRVVLPPIVVSNTYACQFPYIFTKKKCTFGITLKIHLPPQKNSCSGEITRRFFIRIFCLFFIFETDFSHSCLALN